MSSKDYIEVAAIIHDQAVGLNPSEYPLRSLTIENIATSLAAFFKRDNPRFNHQRFYLAAGLDQNGHLLPDH